MTDIDRCRAVIAALEGYKSDGIPPDPFVLIHALDLLRRYGPVGGETPCESCYNYDDDDRCTLTHGSEECKKQRHP